MSRGYTALVFAVAIACSPPEKSAVLGGSLEKRFAAQEQYIAELAKRVSDLDKRIERLDAQKTARENADAAVIQREASRLGIKLPSAGAPAGAIGPAEPARPFDLGFQIQSLATGTPTYAKALVSVTNRDDRTFPGGRVECTVQDRSGGAIAFETLTVRALDPRQMFQGEVIALVGGRAVDQWSCRVLYAK